MKRIAHPQALMSPLAWEWLSFKPSLTQRLRTFTQQQISFHLIHEDWETINGQTIWVRKIQWRLNKECWIEAHLLIPKTSINPETECLLATHERPIGEQLFQEPTLARSDFLFFQPENFTADAPCWVRESTFHFRGQPLTLKETFFPAFFQGIQNDYCSNQK